MVRGARQTTQENLLATQLAQGHGIIGQECTERAVDEWRMGDDAQKREHLLRQVLQDFAVKIILYQ
ncbi:hypothetical protein D3C84_975160 [compost metagenome]